MFFTDAAINFVKELLSSLEDIQKEHGEIQDQLHNYGRRLKQFSTFREVTVRDVTVKGSADESFFKNVYVGIEPDDVMPKPVLLDEAIEILGRKVGELGEQLEYIRKQEELTVELLDKLTKDYYPGILEEIRN